MADRLGRLPEVTDVGTAAPSPLTDAILVPVTLAENIDGADAIVPVLAELAEVPADHPGLQVETIGDHSITHGINEVVAEDLASAGMLSVPVTLAILLVVFGALVAAGVPLLLSLSAVAAGVPLLLSLAVGVDYSLFYLRREREERARGHGTVDAVRIAAATSGPAVVVSGLTSVVALAGLFLSGDAIFEALGTSVILAVAVAMIGSVTVLPALLVKLGRAMDRPRVRDEPEEQHRGRPAALHPGDAAYDRLVEANPGEGNTHQVVVQAPVAQADAVRSGLDQLATLTGSDRSSCRTTRRR